MKKKHAPLALFGFPILTLELYVLSNAWIGNFMVVSMLIGTSFLIGGILYALIRAFGGKE